MLFISLVLVFAVYCLTWIYPIYHGFSNMISIQLLNLRKKMFAERNVLRRKWKLLTLFMFSLPLFALIGDTTFDCFLEPQNADILRSRILITEATYIDDRQSPAKAHERGHTHLMDIAGNAELFRNVGALVLVHLSDRYNAGHVDYWIRRCLPPWLVNKTWVPTIAKDFEWNSCQIKQIYLFQSIKQSMARWRVRFLVQFLKCLRSVGK